MRVARVTLRNWLSFRGTHSLSFGSEAHGVTARLRSDAERSNWLGKSHQALDHHKDALPHLEAAAKAQPDNPEYLLDLGMVYVDLDRAQDAQQVQQRLAALDPKRAAELATYIEDAP